MTNDRLDRRTLPARAWPPFVSRAACTDRTQVAPDDFFPQDSRTPVEALQVCATCPVRLDCLTWALRTDQRHGVWGGTTAGQRRALAGR